MPDVRKKIGALAVMVLALAGMVGGQAAKTIPAKPFPEFTHGDDCLFCHRNDVGANWQENAHTITVRQKDDAPELMKILSSQPALASLAADVGYYMLGRSRVRYLKKEGYGRLEILSTQTVVAPAVHGKNGAVTDRPVKEWVNLANPTWDKDKFQDRCSGCHMTAVDSTTKQFAEIGHDCFTCHGDAPREHTEDPTQVLLAKRRKEDPKVVVSLCAQCHLRGGKSKTTGLPYAYNFVPGEDLFKDYQVDFNKADDKTLNPGDRHIYWVAREVIQRGETKVTCLSCHQVHTQSVKLHWTAFRHRGSNPPVCFFCHSATDTDKYTPGYVVHSGLCEY
jgi:hypothetical protein